MPCMHWVHACKRPPACCSLTPLDSSHQLTVAYHVCRYHGNKCYPAKCTLKELQTQHCHHNSGLSCSSLVLTVTVIVVHEHRQLRDVLDHYALPCGGMNPTCLLLTTLFGCFLGSIVQAATRVSSCQQTVERLQGSPAAQISTGSLPTPQSTTRASAGASPGACTATIMIRTTHNGLGTNVAALASPTHRTAERSDSHVAYRRRPSLRHVNASQGRRGEGCSATWGTPTRANSVPQIRLRKTAHGTADGHRPTSRI